MNTISTSPAFIQPVHDRTPIGFTVGDDLVKEGMLIKDLYQSMDNVPGLDADPRKGFVDLGDPRKHFDKAAFTSDNEGKLTSLTLSNSWGTNASQVWTYDLNEYPSTLTVNHHTYGKLDETVYHFDFGPTTEPWMERNIVW